MTDPSSIAAKAAHVRAAGQDRDHSCHWPGCGRQVPPAKWGCLPHWKALPKPLRHRAGPATGEAVLTDGGYTRDQVARMHGYDKVPERPVPKDCGVGASYDGKDPPACFPVCDACLTKWLETAA